MKKLLQTFLILVLCLCLCITSFAKEEVIYVNLNYDGTVDDITAVNILKPDEEGNIVDYGDYTSIRNMTTKDNLSYNGYCITGKTDAEKLYVEGKTNRTDIPWKVYIYYYLDHEEIKPEELAGKSGFLEIFMYFRGSMEDTAFYDNYCLEVSATLDTDICKNIIAEDATIANVGSNKQLTYIILPKMDKDIEISCDVIDFEMDPITINGVNMNMGIDTHEVDLGNFNQDYNDLMDDLDDMDEGLNDMLEGSLELMDGASDLSKGIHNAYNGLDDLFDALAPVISMYGLDTQVNKLMVGMRRLDGGAADLYNGTEEFRDGIAEFYDKVLEVKGDSSSQDKVKDKMNEVLDDAFGKNFVPISYTSPYNTDVESVIFAMKTPKIEILEEEEEIVEETTQTFWEKFIGLYKGLFEGLFN